MFILFSLSLGIWHWCWGVRQGDVARVHRCWDGSLRQAGQGCGHHHQYCPHSRKEGTPTYQKGTYNSTALIPGKKAPLLIKKVRTIVLPSSQARRHPYLSKRYILNISWFSPCLGKFSKKVSRNLAKIWKIDDFSWEFGEKNVHPPEVTEICVRY